MGKAELDLWLITRLKFHADHRVDLHVVWNLQCHSGKSLSGLQQLKEQPGTEPGGGGHRSYDIGFLARRARQRPAEGVVGCQ